MTKAAIESKFGFTQTISDKEIKQMGDVQISVSGSFEKFGAKVSGDASGRSKWSSNVSRCSSPTLVTLAVS